MYLVAMVLLLHDIGINVFEEFSECDSLFSPQSCVSTCIEVTINGLVCSCSTFIHHSALQ